MRSMIDWLRFIVCVTVRIVKDLWRKLVMDRVLNVRRFVQEVREDREKYEIVSKGWRSSTLNWLLYGERQGMGKLLTVAIREGDESKARILVEAERFREAERFHGYRWGTVEKKDSRGRIRHEAKGWQRVKSGTLKIVAGRWLNKGTRGVENKKEAWLHTPPDGYDSELREDVQSVAEAMKDRLDQVHAAEMSNLLKGEVLNIPEKEFVTAEDIHERFEKLRAIGRRSGNLSMVVARGHGKTAADKLERELLEADGYIIEDVPGVGWKVVGKKPGLSDNVFRVYPRLD